MICCFVIVGQIVDVYRLSSQVAYADWPSAFTPNPLSNHVEIRSIATERLFVSR